MEDNTNVDYGHAKRIYEDFELKNLGEYHDCYVQSDILFLFLYLRTCTNMSLKIYETQLAKFCSAPGSAWQVALKKTKKSFN